jgi:predicted DNA-binding transcriptional regulator AlpA
MNTRQFGTAKTKAKPAGERYLTVKDLPAKGINYHTNHLRRMWNDGRFPLPNHLSPRRLVWAESVIDAWLASKIEAA